MNADAFIEALQLPAASRVDQRVAKKLLIDHLPPRATDKKRVSEGIEELTWVAALKPAHLGVPAYRDEEREYLEVAVLSLVLRADVKADRIVGLVHRAIPYPALVIASQKATDNPASQEATLNLSVAPKRLAQREAGKFVLEGEPIAADLPEAVDPLYLAELRPAALPKANVRALYDGWRDRIEALQAAKLTGRCAVARDAQAAAARRQALVDVERLTREIAAVRTRAAKETQLAKRVELNLEAKRLDTALSEAKANL